MNNNGQRQEMLSTTGNIVESRAVPPSVPRLITAPSPATLPNALVDELVRGGERRTIKAGSGTARSANSGIIEYSDDFEMIRPHDLSGCGSRHSVDTLNSEEVLRT